MMDEDELLYREMNEEDPYYMGDVEEPIEECDEYEDTEVYEETSSSYEIPQRSETASSDETVHRKKAQPKKKRDWSDNDSNAGFWVRFLNLFR